MKVIVCELCEGREFAKQDGMFVCQSCGSKYTPEDAKKLMIEVEGDAPASAARTGAGTNTDLERYLTLARRASESDNNADAAKYYGLAQTEAPDSWECLFFSTYHTAMQTNIAGISSAALLVNNCLNSVIDLIANSTPEEEKLDAARKVASHCVVISQMLFNAAKNHYNGIGDSIRSNYTGEYRQRASAARLITDTLASLLEAHFGDNPDYYPIIAESRKNGFDLKENNGFAFDNEIVSIEDLEKIAKFDPSYARTRAQGKINAINNSVTNLSNSKQSNGCLAALCALGSVLFLILQLVLGETGYVYGVLICAALTVVCAIPKPKSASKLEKDKKEIDRLNANKARLEKLL